MVRKAEQIIGKKGVVVVATNRGAWTADEDKKLVEYVRAHGDENWRTLPAIAGLNRCGKSCRLRWLNYLRPGIKRGNISEEEEDLIIRLHNLLGNRWSLIAGRLLGRTDNEIKIYWNAHLSKRSLSIDNLNSQLNQRLVGTGGLARPLPTRPAVAARCDFTCTSMSMHHVEGWIRPDGGTAHAPPLLRVSPGFVDEVEKLLNLAPNPNGGRTNGAGELLLGGAAEEAYDGSIRDGSQDLLRGETCTTKVVGCSDRHHQAVWDASEFDDLDKFINWSQDLGFYFFN